VSSGGGPIRGRSQIRVHTLVDTLGPGGAEFLVAEFAEVAHRVDIELSVAALKPLTPPAPAADRLRARGVVPQAVPVTSMVDPRGMKRVRAHLERVRPDVVQTHLATSDFLGGMAARSLGIPSVVTIHADWWPSGGADRIRNWLTFRARRLCADAVVAVSRSARAAYLEASGDDQAHVVVVHNGIVDRAVPGSGAAVRRELGLADEDLVLTTVSSLRPEKNFETAIDAVGLLRRRFPTTRLVIAGEGPYEDVVRRHAARLGSAVVVAGHREDVMALLDATDILVHPSRFDAFPTALLEAMAASVPVVATEVGGMVEIVEPDVTGVLIPPPPSAARLAAALDPLLQSEAVRRRLGAAGRARYEREFSAEVWAGRVRAVYDGVLACRRR
jgi:glycosyltransferase involved in cell wall biosynthesis